MKLNKVLLPVAAATLLLTGCYDEKMEWYTPADHGAVTESDIPLQLSEILANYDYIKSYAAQYMPGTPIGLGITANKFTEGLDGYDSAYAAVARQNFQMFTAGNAMKHQSVVKSNGSLDLATVEPFVQQANAAGIEVFGHNFIWHTQQNQNYLKSLILPELVIESDEEEKCENIITNSGFEDGTDQGWTGWSHYSRSVVEGGHDSDYALKCTMDSETSQNWDCQLWWTLSGTLQEGVTYYYGFWVKSPDNINVQFIGQNASYSGLYKNTVTAGNTWVLCEGEFVYDGNPADVVRIGLQFGGTPNSVVYIDDFKFGKKIEDPMDNIITNTGFEDGTDQGWTGWSHYSRTVEEGGHSGSYALKCTMDSETAQNWDCQLWWPLAESLQEGVIYSYSFYIKSPDGVKAQFVGQNASYSGIYKETFDAPKDWLKCEGEFTYDGNPEDIVRIGLQFGGIPNSVLWVDDFKFGKKKDQTPAAARKTAPRRATKITYIFKTPEEKRELLLGAMKEWIEGMAQACPTVKQWDVVNEPISDGNHKWRGFDGTFGMEGDGTPVENEEEGLNLNWANDTGNGHFYWGYFIGRDYAARAFEYARAAIGADAKLYVNEYGLESSPGKTQALIDFVKYIDENGAHVDGIGTQMHVTISTSNDEAKNAEELEKLKAKVDAMFQTLAQTGKLVRVSELDIAFGTTNGEEVSPSATQFAAQGDAYRMIMESYKANVPDAQRGGFCIWTLSDNKDEHEYWLKGDKPNLFDKNYARKHAYKGLCDGIVGKDVSEDFSGEDWKKLQ